MSTILRAVAVSTVRRRLGAAAAPVPTVAPAMPEPVAVVPVAAPVSAPVETVETVGAGDKPVPDVGRTAAVPAAAAMVAAQLAAARREGYDEGRREALEEAETQWREQALRINAMGASFVGAQQALLAQAEDALVALAFEALCNILGDTVATKDGVHAIVMRLLALMPEAGAATVRLHPADAALFEQAVADHPDLLAAQLKIVPDASLVMGGCMVDAPGATLEARLDWQIAQLRTVLLDVRATRAGPP